VLIQNCVAAENVSVIGNMQPSLSNHWTGINSDQIGLNEKNSLDQSAPDLGCKNLMDKMTKRTDGQKLKEQRKDD